MKEKTPRKLVRNPFFQLLIKKADTMVAIAALLISLYTFKELIAGKDNSGQLQVLKINHNIDNLMMQYPHLHPIVYGVEAVPDSLSHENIHRLRILAEMHCDLFHRQTFADFSENQVEREAWNLFVAETFEKSSVICCFLKNNKRYYPQLYNVYEKHLKCDCDQI